METKKELELKKVKAEILHDYKRGGEQLSKCTRCEFLTLKNTLKRKSIAKFFYVM